MSISQLLPLILLLPLIGGAINGIFGKKLPKVLVGSIATLATSLSFVFALMIFFQIDEAVRVNLFTILSLPNIELNASFLADNLSIWMTLIVTGVGALIHLFSMGYMKEDPGYYKFFTYLNLFIFSMLLLILGSNYFILFFGWEGVGVCSYLLIGFWYADAEKGMLNSMAARKAFVMNRIGDLALLIGMFLILNKFGTLEYLELANIVNLSQIVASPELMLGITICLFIGATGKSAQIPLFTWLPDAMAGPTPVSALIHAATMVTAGIFLVVRSNFFFELAPVAQDVMLYIGLITSIVAAFIAMRQNDIKKVLAYSTVSQLGLLFVALGMGAYTVAIFHVTTHAFFKALLFLGSGSVIHAVSEEQDIRKMGGLKSKIPVTHITFLIGTLAITGFPLLSGFYSKDEILAHAFSQNVGLYIMVLISVVMTAMYMFRLYFVTFHGTYRGSKESEAKIHEGAPSMTIPLVVLAVLSVVGGAINLPGVWLKNQAHWLASHLEHNTAGLKSVITEHLSGTTTMMLMVVAVIVTVSILAVSYMIYVKRNSIPVEDSELSGWEKVSANKLYVDEIYNFLFVRPIVWMSEKGYSFFEMYFLNGIVALVTKGIVASGERVKKWQSGYANLYVLWMVSGIVGLIVYYLVKI